MVGSIFLILFDSELCPISTAFATVPCSTYHDCGEADGGAGEPAQSLESEHGIDIVREFFVLDICQCRLPCARL